MEDYLEKFKDLDLSDASPDLEDEIAILSRTFPELTLEVKCTACGNDQVEYYESDEYNEDLQYLEEVLRDRFSDSGWASFETKNGLVILCDQCHEELQIYQENPEDKKTTEKGDEGFESSNDPHQDILLL